MREQSQPVGRTAHEADILRWLLNRQGGTMVAIALAFPDEFGSVVPVEAKASGFDAMTATWSLVRRGLAIMEASYSSPEHRRVVLTELGRQVASAVEPHSRDPRRGDRGARRRSPLAEMSSLFTR